MVSREPMCLSCQYFKGHPKKYGDSARCALKGSCPNSVYWDGKRCASYKSRLENGIRKK